MCSYKILVVARRKKEKKRLNYVLWENSKRNNMIIRLLLENARLKREFIMNIIIDERIEENVKENIKLLNAKWKEMLKEEENTRKRDADRAIDF